MLAMYLPLWSLDILLQSYFVSENGKDQNGKLFQTSLSYNIVMSKTADPQTLGRVLGTGAGNGIREGQRKKYLGSRFEGAETFH